MPAPLGSVFEMTLRSSLAGQTILSVFHYRVIQQSTTPLITDEQQQFANFIDAAGVGSFKANYLLCCPGNMDFKETKVQMIFDTRFRSSSSFGVGSGGRGPANTANLAAVITKRTVLAGRSKIGSVHIPTGDATDVSNGLLDIGFITTLSTFGTNIKTVITVPTGGGVYEPVIYHRKPELGAPSAITDAFAQETARVMRRRTVGLGI